MAGSKRQPANNLHCATHQASLLFSAYCAYQRAQIPLTFLTAFAVCFLCGVSSSAFLISVRAGYVCCNYLTNSNQCQEGSLFYIVRWVATRGYWQFPGTFHTNDGAVLQVVPATPGTINPIPIGVSTFNTRFVPPLVLGGTGFPCGNDAQPPAGTRIDCVPNYPAYLLPPCIGSDLNPIPGVCTWGGSAFLAVCCRCYRVDLKPTAGFCLTLSQLCEKRYAWQSAAPVSPFPNIMGYLPPGNTGQLLTYAAPGCYGDYGAPLVNYYANSIFGVLVETSAACDQTAGGQSGLGLSYYAQFVDRGQQDGVWVGALASALIGQAPFGQGG